MKKELKSIVKFNIIFFIVLLLTSCNPTINEPFDNDFKCDVFPEEYKGILVDKDIYITSIGQAIDIEDFLIEVQYIDSIKYSHNNFLKSIDVPNNSVVMVIIGCSIKGLGDAGITIQGEKDRAQAFIDDAKSKRITVIAWHIGGMARRGSTSDNLINVVFSGASLDVFIKFGNTDNFLSSIARNNKVPCYQINYLGEIAETLRLLMLPNKGE